MTDVTDWRILAACRDTVANGRDPFFSGAKQAEAEALAICKACPVRAECLAFAIRMAPEFGIWGGKPQRELRKLITADRAGKPRAERNTPHHNAVKTECRNGHPYDAANTYYTPGGDRRCRTCLRLNRQKWAARGPREPKQSRRPKRGQR